MAPKHRQCSLILAHFFPLTQTQKMALRIHLFTPHAFAPRTTSQTRPLRITARLTGRPKTQILCNLGDADLATALASEVAKINTHEEQRDEALKKSKELLFIELCRYLALDKEDVKRRWNGMDGEEKLVLFKEFVNEWSFNFHPLSARSVKEMIEEFLHDGKLTTSTTSELFPGLKRMIEFS